MRLYGGGGITKGHNPLLHKNLSTIIRFYKGRATFEIHNVNTGFAWQARFYDRIIRNENELNLISEYIALNPQNWEKDDYYE